MNKINKKNLFSALLLFAIGVACFFTYSWILRDKMYFLFDDINWIKRVKYDFDIKHFLHVFPTSRYNDRPLRTLFFYILYNLFGMEYQKYYLAVLILHIVVVYLYFYLVYRVITRCDVDPQKAFGYAYVCAIFFGMFPKNGMAVYWLAGAANDMLCTFFAVICIIFHLKFCDESKSNWKKILWAIASLLMYICSMRSKEAAIGLPIILGIHDIYMAYRKKKKPYITGNSIVCSIYMLIYVIRIFTLPVGLTGAGQYEQNFSPISMMIVLFNYIKMYFSIDSPSFTYDAFWDNRLGNVGLVIISAIIALAIYKIYINKEREKNIALLCLCIAAGVTLAPLLVLPNIQHLLYFYFPGIILSMLLGICLYDILNLGKGKFSTVLPIVFTFVLLIILNNVGGAKSLQNFWIDWGEKALTASQDIENLRERSTNANIYVKNANQGANIFNYGPGAIVNILYDDSNIHVFLLEDVSSELIEPYVVWQYDETTGHVIYLE